MPAKSNLLIISPDAVIDVLFAERINEQSSIEDISAILDSQPQHQIAHAPWPEFPYRPECRLAMMHNGKSILLKFFVTEDNILARFDQPNDMVHRDSCVEFFVAFNNEAHYYNLEFNCIGTCYLGYGLSDDQREVSDTETVKKIKSSFMLQNDNNKIKWELTLVIPNEVFYHHNITNLAAVKCKGNFYKCGDELPVRHYLAWSDIQSAEPNFHLPEFFGEVNFN